MIFTYNPVARWLARQVLPVLYAGSRLHCPCCDRSFRGFIGRHGVDAMCPGCLAMQRHRLLVLYLLSETTLASGELALLHVAPEEGLQEKLTRIAGERYITIDASPTSIATVTGDVTAIPFEAEMFDLIICSHVLEHVVEDGLALREFARVLRPGARALLLQPVHEELEATVEDSTITSPRDRLRVFGQRDHVRIYGRDFVQRVIDAGFSVEKLDYIARLDRATIDRYGLGTEFIYVATRQA